MKQQAVLTGKDFKEVVAAVTKLPSLGNFAGSEQINITVADGKFTASTFGIVLARARVPAEGALSLVATERRIFEAFAPFCADATKVTMRVAGNELITKCRTEVASSISVGQVYNAPSVKNMAGVKLSAAAAKRIVFLSNVAFSDSSRAELCCVMLTSKGEAIACNQKTVAVLKIAGCKQDIDVAIPLPMAKIMSAGDILYVGKKETVLRSGIATYSMPSAIKAQKEFPLTAVRSFSKLRQAESGSVVGTKLVNVASECSACLGQAARTEIIIVFTLAGGKMELTAQNGGARFRAPLTMHSAGEDVVFKVPLEGLMQALPFVEDNAAFSRGKNGELFLGVSNGWVMFPSWEEGKKVKK